MSRVGNALQSFRAALENGDEATVHKKSTKDASEPPYSATPAQPPPPDSNDLSAGGSQSEMSRGSVAVVDSDVVHSLSDAGKAHSPSTTDAFYSGELTQLSDPDSTGKRRRNTRELVLVATYRSQELVAALLKSLTNLIVMAKETLDRLKSANKTNHLRFFIFEAKYWDEELQSISHRARAYMGHYLIQLESLDNQYDSETIHAETEVPAYLPTARNEKSLPSSGPLENPQSKIRCFQTSRSTARSPGERGAAAMNHYRTSGEVPEVPSSNATAQSPLAHVPAHSQPSEDLQTMKTAVKDKAIGRLQAIPSGSNIGSLSLAEVNPRSARSNTTSGFVEVEADPVTEAKPGGSSPTNGRHLEPLTTRLTEDDLQVHDSVRESPHTFDGGNWRRVLIHSPADSDMTVARRRATTSRVGALDPMSKVGKSRIIDQLRAPTPYLAEPQLKPKLSADSSLKHIPARGGRTRLIDSDQLLIDDEGLVSVLGSTADPMQRSCPQAAVRLRRPPSFRTVQVGKYRSGYDDERDTIHGDWPRIRCYISRGTSNLEQEQSSPYIAHQNGIQQSTSSGSVGYRLSAPRSDSTRSLSGASSIARSPSSNMTAHRSHTVGFHSVAAARIQFPQTGSGSTDEGQTVPSTNAEAVLLAGSPLGYHIPSAKMRESLLASRSSRSAYWQYTFYQGPKGEKVKVHYCKSLETTERIAKLFLNESVLGFDIEWKPSATAKDGIRKNVALIQIASEERIALFHIARFSKGDTIDEMVSPTFKKLMESDTISKVGVSVKGDCSRLRKYMNIKSRGLFELSHLYKLVKFCTADVKKINKLPVKLATQVEEHLLLPMYKDRSVRGSDWSEDLNYDQIYYAASDPYAGFQLYHIMNNQRRSIHPSPPLPAHVELNLPIRLADGQTVPEYEEYSVEKDKETKKPLPPAIEQLIQNLQIEDSPSEETDQKSEEAQPRPQPRQPTLQSSHPAIIAATEWLTEYRLQNPLNNTITSPSTTTESTSLADVIYPTLPSIPSSTNKVPPSSSSATAAAAALASSSSSSSPSTRKSTPQKGASPASLRAYHLFFHQELEVETIAALLRDPPLQKRTVIGYVLDAVRLEMFGMPEEQMRRLEGLEAEAERMEYKWMGYNRAGKS
ncbi:MAG: hypothetical protein LQ352_005517 [Teloschistes flavicans]|nr:MAG: hypothetical protein LQ352_005517 [Teloschistes flavicans]